jgi:hypothetical protein
MTEKPPSPEFLTRMADFQPVKVEDAESAFPPEAYMDPVPLPEDRAELFTLVQQAKGIAKRYRELTGRPLGITGEIAECEAVRLLDLELAPVRTAGYDVIRYCEDGTEQHLQVKGRVMLPNAGRGQRVGSIDKNKEWDGVLLVLMDQNFETVSIYEAPRAPVVAALNRPGGKARTERGALAVSQFIRIAQKIWPPIEP